MEKNYSSNHNYHWLQAILSLSQTVSKYPIQPTRKFSFISLQHPPKKFSHPKDGGSLSLQNNETFNHYSAATQNATI
jgi:hypothetical protein